MYERSTKLQREGLLVASGIVVELIGLAADVIVHAGNPDLAAHEGPTTLANPAHMLFLAGLVLSIVGVVRGIALRAADHSVTRSNAVRGVGAVVVASVLAAATMTGGAHAHPSDARTAATEAVRHIGHGGVVHSGDEVKVGWDDITRIDTMLATTKAATMKYRDVRRAVADGYGQQGPSLRGAGAHFLNQSILDAGVFDPARPTVMLYERQPDWSFELVGVAWLLPKKPLDSTPPSAFGPLGVWHSHSYPTPGICIGPRGASNLVGEACRSDGGRFWTESPWMLHAWLYRPSPDGVFSLVNTEVRGPQIDPDLGGHIIF